jgi:hypothetical protein
LLKFSVHYQAIAGATRVKETISLQFRLGDILLRPLKTVIEGETAIKKP